MYIYIFGAVLHLPTSCRDRMGKRISRCFSMMGSSIWTITFILVLFLCWDHCECIGLLPESEKESLLAIKRSIREDPLQVLSDWGQDSLKNACNWTGITCSATDPARVLQINLPSKNLVGTFAAEIGNLTSLRILDFSNNSLGGSIPSSVGLLSNLKMMLLQQNKISGSIPSEIGNITSLVVLNLSQNNLSGGIPFSLGQLHELRFLHLFRNINLGGQVPTELGQLKKLQEFVSYGNGHTGRVPVTLCNCTNLKVLDLSENKLTDSLPDCIGLLSNLQRLNAGQNFLSGGFVPGILNCTNLELLQLSVNRMWGQIPADIGSKLQKLRVLSLSENNFRGEISSSVANMTGLSRLALSDNLLTGHIPLCLGTLSNLQFLDLGKNMLQSKREGPDQEISVLKAISNCSKLVNLEMYDNHLTGVVPPELGKLGQTLQYLLLSRNFIKGNLPATIGNLSSLISLSLSDNFLSGRIPPLIGMRFLQKLDLSDNGYVGSIPTAFALMNQSLTYIYLGGNRLSGLIPVFLGRLGNLRELCLNRNFFSGQIPSELGNALLLENLDLSANNLSGRIPEEVANLQYIHVCFNLSNNALTGTVPSTIGGMLMAECIDLSNNKLSGNITLQMSQWLSLTILNLSFNSFTGVLPDSLGHNLAVLEVIDLSRNSFSGPLPYSLNGLSNLKFLNFSDNEFRGSVNCSGSFKHLNRSSFLNNPDLCGTCMGFLPCKQENHIAKKHITIIIYSTVGILVGISSFVLTFLAVREWAKQQRAAAALAKLEIALEKTELFMSVSEEEICRATKNFSPSNLVGEGSYSRVYIGAIKERQVVAVKVFHDLGEWAERSFFRECQVLRMVRHRNVVKIITVYSKQNFRALIMEYVPNGTLDRLLHTRLESGHLVDLGIQLRVQILHGLATALCYLHHDCKPAVLHGDVKPKNVLLDEDMTPRLADFGLAELLAPSAASSFAFPTAPTLTGTVGYTAPEYGVGGCLSSKGDVYSFGVVVLEVLTRTRPNHPMFRGHRSLRSWVSMAIGKNGKVCRERLLEIVIRDDENSTGFQSEHELRGIESLAKLGLWCTSNERTRRPTMIKVEAILAELLSKKSPVAALHGSLADERLAFLWEEPIRPVIPPFYIDSPFDTVVESLTLANI